MRSKNHKLIVMLIFSLGLWSGKHLDTMTKRAPPESHAGIRAVNLGAVDGKSMQQTLNLDGYKLQMREIGLAPGGSIARHSHETRPGLVWMLEGSWTEGRESGESTLTAGSKTGTLVEDENTIHWFFNDTNELASAIVCDIVPDS